MKCMLWFSLWGALLLFAAAPFALAGDMLVQDPWIREAPPTAKALAAYMVLTNTGKQQVKLLRVTSPGFGTVEIHQTTMHQGMMQMIAQDNLVVNPGSSTVLAPGGYHLMLLEPRQPVRAGERITLQLQFDQGENLILQVPVRRQGQ